MPYQTLYHPTTLWQPPAHQTFGLPKRRFPDLTTTPDPTLGPRAPYTSPEAFAQLHHLLLMAMAYDLPYKALSGLHVPPNLAPSPLYLQQQAITRATRVAPSPLYLQQQAITRATRVAPSPLYLQQQAKRFFNTLPVAIQPQLRILLAKAAQHPLTPSQSAFLALLSDPIRSRRITLPSVPLSAPKHPSPQLRWLRPLLSLTITRYARAHSLYLPVPGTRTRFTKTKTPQSAQCPRCQSNLLLIPAGYAQPAKPLETLCNCGTEDAALNLWLNK